MPVAARVNPLELFSQDQWSGLIAKSSWRGVWLVAHAWGVIGLAMVLGAVWPWLIPLLILIVANRQLGLLILMHDAAHGLLHPNRKVNDALCNWFCSSGLHGYRVAHLKHHRFAQQVEDPDLPLSKPFPISQDSLLRKVRRDISGLTFLKLRLGIDLERALHTRIQKNQRSTQQQAPTGSSLINSRARLDPRSLWGSLLFLIAFSAAGYAWLWFALWLLPAACVFPFVYRLRNIAEHALVPLNEPSPYRHARTTLASLWERAFLAPYWVNYHCEHHLFTQVPCWNLPKAHALLKEKGLLDQMLIAPSYFSVLRAVTLR